MAVEQHISKAVAVKNSMWKLLESFGSKGISMVVTIILARILTPEDYGIIAMTAVFTNLTDILIQGGFSTALIRKEKLNDSDYSTVFVISLLCATVLYAIIFAFAPAIAAFYNTPILSSVLRVMSLVLFCQAFAAVRTAVVSREMKFKVLLYCTLISNVVSGTVGIILAYMGFGVWALVVQQCMQQVLLTVILYASVKIKVSLKISKQSVKEILPFSLKVLLSSLLSFIGDSLYSISIGKMYSMRELGLYDKGGQFPRQFSLYTFSAVSNVFLPVFSSYTDDYDKLNAVFQRVLTVSCYVIMPLMAGLCMTAKPFIILLLTEKWLPCVEILRWSCLYYMATPILLTNVQLHFAIGKGETRIKVELLRIALMVGALVFFLNVKMPIVYIVACLSFIQIITSAFIFWETKKATGYRIKNFFSGIKATAAATGGMCVCIYAISLVNISNVFLLFICEVAVGMLSYWLLSVVLHSEGYKEVKSMAGIILKKGK